MSTCLKRTSRDVLSAVERFCAYHDLFHQYPKMENILDTGTFVHGPYDVFSQEFIEAEFEPVRRSYGSEAGYVPLKQAVVDLENKLHGTAYTQQDVAIMPGAWAALEFAIEEALQLEWGNSQGSIAVIGPTLYPMFHRPIWIYGMKVLGYDFVHLEQPHVPQTMDDIEETFQAHPRLIVISNPNNPDGMYFPSPLLKEVVERAGKEQIYVLLDEIQNFFPRAETGLQYGPWVQAPHVIRVDSPGKRYGLAAYRVGWVINNVGLLGDRRKGIVGRMSTMLGNAPKALDKILVTILERERTGSQSFLQDLIDELQKKEDYVLSRLKNISRVAEIYTRDACVDLAFRVDYPQKDDLKLAEALMSESTLMMPCSGYGYNPEDSVLRITFTEPLQVLERGLNALERVLNA